MNLSVIKIRNTGTPYENVKLHIWLYANVGERMEFSEFGKEIRKDGGRVLNKTWSYLSHKDTDDGYSYYYIADKDHARLSLIFKIKYGR